MESGVRKMVWICTMLLLVTNLTWLLMVHRVMSPVKSFIVKENRNG